VVLKLPSSAIRQISNRTRPAFTNLLLDAEPRTAVEYDIVNRVAEKSRIGRLVSKAGQKRRHLLTDLPLQRAAALIDAALCRRFQLVRLRESQSPNSDLKKQRCH
jgi:hypothetical protein